MFEKRSSIRPDEICKFQNGIYKDIIQIDVCSTMLMGLIALLVSSVIIVVNPYDIIFSYKVKMSEGSESLDLWATPPVELFLKVYLFNVTNREAFLAGKEKLRVQEVGPYVYREGMAHVNVSMNDNGTVTATPIHPLTWVPELSNGKEDDILILPNIALLSFANVMAKASLLTRMGVNLLIKQTKRKMENYSRTLGEKN
ncbi:scavenger receptor class B member 1-like [Diaphorina citri]|uniref:Scavenger receptor class B member 1-like n=1 Tax=Diaphorina citri TaxID=121845 RepID=A0A1S3CV40_DIACI|nr:scavenger receptor class B member 1-like [Diaphorina citri]